jgi:transcriptional regulator with XRE-family HTH domain
VSDRQFTARLNWLFANVPKPGTSDLWTNKELADAINARPGEAQVSYSYLSSLRNGDRANPSFLLTEAIAAEFGVGLDYFSNPAEQSTGPIVLAGTEDLQLGPDELDLLRKLARMLSRRSAAGPFVPVNASSLAADRPLTEHDAYRANDLVNALNQAAEIYERTFGDAEAGAALRANARSILSNFALAAAGGHRPTNQGAAPTTPR